MNIRDIILEGRTEVVPANSSIVSGLGGPAGFIRFLSAPREFSFELDGSRELVGFTGLSFPMPAGVTFSRVKLNNPYDSPMTIRFYYGNVQVGDSSLQIWNRNASRIRTMAPDGLATIAPVDVTTPSGIIVPKNEDSDGVHIYNPDEEETLWVGDANVAVGRGIPIGPGETQLIKTSDDIWAVAANPIAGVSPTRFFFR